MDQKRMGLLRVLWEGWRPRLWQDSGSTGTWLGSCPGRDFWGDCCQSPYLGSGVAFKPVPRMPLGQTPPHTPASLRSHNVPRLYRARNVFSFHGRGEWALETLHSGWWGPATRPSWITPKKEEQVVGSRRSPSSLWRWGQGGDSRRAHPR